MPQATRPDFAPIPMTMNAKEAAAYLGLNLNGLYRRTASGEIRSVVWGRSARNLRCRKADLDSWLVSLPVRTGPVRAKPTPRRKPEPVDAGPEVGEEQGG
jgi:excisionase family DNA binding protein